MAKKKATCTFVLHKELPNPDCWLKLTAVSTDGLIAFTHVHPGKAKDLDGVKARLVSEIEAQRKAQAK